jgi:hypothetical protein
VSFSDVISITQAPLAAARPPHTPYTLRAMASRAELERMDGEHLHDLAVRRAAKHLDVKFFWKLIEVLPAAEAAAGNMDEAERDLSWAMAHVDDITDSGRGETAEVLRPFYIDYLADD